MIRILRWKKSFYYLQLNLSSDSDILPGTF